MKETLFSRLVPYSQNPKKQSIENFTTELLAYLINEDRVFRRVFVGHIISDGRMVRRFRNASASTQQYYSNGIVDLEVENFHNQKVLVEVKIRGSETLTHIRGQGLISQIKKYLQYRQGPVAYLTTRDVPSPDGGTTNCYLGQFYFEDLYKRLNSVKWKLTEFGRLYLQFMEERNMIPPEPFNRKDIRGAQDAFLFSNKCTSILDEIKDKITPDFRKIFRSRTSFTATSFSTSEACAYTYTKYRRGPIKFIELALYPGKGELWFGVEIYLDIRDDRSKKLATFLRREKWEPYENGRWLGSYIKLNGDPTDLKRMVTYASKYLKQLNKAIKRAGI